MRAREDARIVHESRAAFDRIPAGERLWTAPPPAARPYPARPTADQQASELECLAGRRASSSHHLMIIRPEQLTVSGRRPIRRSLSSPPGRTSPKRRHSIPLLTRPTHAGHAAASLRIAPCPSQSRLSLSSGFGVAPAARSTQAQVRGLTPQVAGKTLAVNVGLGPGRHLRTRFAS